MIKVTFHHSTTDIPIGFKISGHSGFASHGSDIVCASVSSAAYMAANTVTEILGINATAEDNAKTGLMILEIPEKNADKAKDVLLGFELHIKQIAEQYPKNVTITTEV